VVEVAVVEKGRKKRGYHALARACTKRSLRAMSSALLLSDWR
jgi:hypothetical protein